jgi:hypothetical protein
MAEVESIPVDNSYIETIEDATAYFSGDPRAVAFLALDEDMAWYLQRATKIIDNLPLKGTTYWQLTTDATPGAGEQNRQFPRFIDGVAYGWDIGSSLPEVPQEVLDACCEEALGIYLRHDTQRLQNQREGVASQSISGSSETYVLGVANRYHGLLSKDAYDLLKGFIAGAIEMRF